MIISHQHRFIFIKTHKTAGTSMEIALSRFCGPDDVITPISPVDEATRTQLGHRPPQHYQLPLSRYARSDLLMLLLRGRRLKLFNHIGAQRLQELIDPAIWRDYFKFTIERNPWDKVVSWYYWQHRAEPRPPFDAFVRSGRGTAVGGRLGFDLYAPDGVIAVDHVCRYETLDQELIFLRDRLALPAKPVLAHAKVGHRPNARSYREHYTATERELVAKAFAREIAYFGYQF